MIAKLLAGGADAFDCPSRIPCDMVDNCPECHRYGDDCCGEHREYDVFHDDETGEDIYILKEKK